MYHDLIYRIKNSQPTLDPSASLAVTVEMLNSGKYALFASRELGLKDTLDIAEVFTKALAKVDLPTIGELGTFQPLHVLYWTSAVGQHWGLLYSNGMIVYAEGVEDDAMLLMDKDLAKQHGFTSVKVPIADII